MECRGAIHCAHLESRGIPQGAMNCAPTPCAYLKGIDPGGQPWDRAGRVATNVMICLRFREAISGNNAGPG